MDAELLELARQFESAQQAKSSIRLSERNVVELVQKLHELHIIDFNLLHTVSGKEYITPEQLRHEMVLEIKKLGRVSLIDLADITGVDLYHVENQAQRVVSDDPSGLMLIQGEIVSQSYWDNVAEEINERLQECSQISLAEIAANLNVGSELVASMLEARLGTLVKGRLEGGQLYTPAYVTRVSAMVRGAARGVTVPTNLSFLWGTLQQLLQAMDGAGGVATESSFFQSLFNGLAKEGEILGSLRAGVHWTPTVFATAQRECVDSFFSQNSFISYDTLQNLGISQPVQFLQSRYAEGIPLVTAFAHPSMIEMLDAAVEDAIDRGSWIDSLSVLPTSFGSQDASKILSHCNSVQSALKGNKGMILGDSYVFSNGFIKDVYGRMEKELEVFRLSGSSGVILSDDFHLVMEAKIRTDSGRSVEVNEKKKKKGKSSGARTEILLDDEEIIPLKSKKNQRKGKEASLVLSDTKKGAKKDLARTQEDDLNIPSDDWIMQKILTLVPDFEEQADLAGLEDPLTILGPLANYMRPMLISSLKEKRKTLFTENAGKMKQLLDNLQKKLDEAFLNMQLYEKALDLFEDDQSTSAVLHRHLLRTMAASIGDMLFHNLDMHNKLKNGINVEESPNSESITLGSAERTALAKSFPGSLSKKALAVVEALEGKRVEAFMTSLREVAEDSGLLLKKLDKKLERTLLHSYRKDLTAQVSAETDPVLLLPKVVSLLYIQVRNKALQAPGRAISVAVSRLKDKLDDSAFKILTEYQAATVTLLSLLSASTGDEEDCTSDRILSKRELLGNLMPALKGLVLGTAQS
ncbi:E3 UFM1-protein ligase 1 homolog isoform X1 [Populus nigra]|uniref:E3 UFM1-protein ligase 1 homolog isoform X1 n=1 Tax=Populus nigra TaxID=3691 RepID=UPI002B276AED|nr:E3 UFM1-protein ligase 1 homolog isoform X1 [Populus nigra]XP_061987308.1 E3 UFM1-protein ligase 1 homolog isoform X1 [Populus nigra]XP_061987315.1 E3 UFM1-protein ligase 1 homolog isoform X1 [Populus nigra]XP_061987325.1 E3 UFM1-protein ligase 1 homolog isoform X1 [Populus nigra]XP_061987333.1 E3 UFM1-protein ligase 1 homolog isoform X1 [Populus nigra]XP_061987342.1 E3 UFM1-protein ligase 1 homolog isoform X1 [Populus nigra]XP_061987350.1 E3 UFM1-protein ligase 1 homolog isoform X1 [Popul